MKRRIRYKGQNAFTIIGLVTSIFSIIIPYASVNLVLVISSFGVSEIIKIIKIIATEENYTDIKIDKSNRGTG